jgi:hypothetical protein
MKIVSRSLREQHEQMRRRAEEQVQAQQQQQEEMLKQVDAQAPKALTVKKHPAGKKPLTLKNGAVVMEGHYYNEDQGLVIHPDDISDTGAWEKV